ncbi:MAG: hypothetical protein ACTH0Y_12905, partial [Luteimonas sp.]
MKPTALDVSTSPDDADARPGKPEPALPHPGSPRRSILAVMLCIALPLAAPDARATDPSQARVAPPDESLAERNEQSADDDEPDAATNAAERYFRSNGDPAGGDDALAIGDFATAIGSSSMALGAHSLALGHLATAVGERSTAIGHGVSSSGLSSVAIGGLASLPEYNQAPFEPPPPILDMVTSASGEYATAVGPGAIAGGNAGLAMGAGAEGAAAAR